MNINGKTVSIILNIPLRIFICTFYKKAAAVGRLQIKDAWGMCVYRIISLEDWLMDLPSVI